VLIEFSQAHILMNATETFWNATVNNFNFMC